MFRRKPTDTSAPPPDADDVVVVGDRAVNPYLVLFHEPAGYRAEQVRSLRNRLVAMNPDGEPKALVVTSAVRGVFREDAAARAEAMRFIDAGGR